jgi:hypothetical protein
MEIHYLWALLAGVGAFVAYMIIGTLGFVLLPALKKEFEKFPHIYRGHDAIMKVMPIGMLFMLISMLTLAVIYAHWHQPGASGLMDGLVFGVLVAIFTTGAFVVHNYVNLSISLTLTINSGIAYFVEWVAAGLAIGLIYR